MGKKYKVGRNDMISNELFMIPDPEYRVKPFWFWNARLDHSQLLCQIQNMYEKGIGGFFIHARFGLETEYLSEQWFAAIRICIHKAAELGMEVWLYDENPFPSGIGDLKVSKKKEFRNQYIECIEYALKEGIQSFDSQRGEIQGVHFITSQGMIPIDYQIDFNSNKTTVVLPSDGKVAVYIKKVLEDPNEKYFGIDYMNAEAVQYYFQTTHEKYYSELGEYFGNCIKGIFTDEPTLLPWHHDINWYQSRKDGRVIAWNDDVWNNLHQTYGYDILDLLAGLFFDIGKEKELIRKNFWSVVASFYENSFFKAYQEWCHAHHLILTGHVLLEEGLYFNTIFQGDIIKNLEYLDMPGTDHLCNTTEQDGMEYMVGKASHLPRMKTNIQGQKMVSSTAHLSGKKRIISESFGIGGWGLTLKDMKWIVNWQYVLGINQLCPHAFFYSIEGFRKYDAPPCHMHNSSWRYYQLFSDYTARLSYLLSQGKHKADIALLYPKSSFQSVYVVGMQKQKDKNISDIYDLLCSNLMKLHFDYDIMAEHQLMESIIQNHCLSIAGEQFKVLLIPCMDHLPDELLRKIQKFIKAGGKVVVFNDPNCLNIALLRQKALISNNAEKVFEVPIRDLDDPMQVTLFRQEVKDAVMACLDPEVIIEGKNCEEIYYTHRQLQDEELFLFVNTSKDKCIEVDIFVSLQGTVMIFDCDTGAVKEYSAIHSRKNRTHMKHHFCEASSLLISIQKSDIQIPEKQSLITSTTSCDIVLSNEGWQLELEGYNTYPIQDWNFSMIIHGGGMQYRYNTVFHMSDIIEDMKLLLDDVEYRKAFMGHLQMEIRINGLLLSGKTGTYLDPGFKTWDIGSCVQRGENKLEIIIQHSAWSNEPQLLTSPVKILGHFKVTEQDGKQIIMNPDAFMNLDLWTNIGYPYYSGTAVYKNEFYIEKFPTCAYIIFSEVHDCVEVRVNGKKAECRAWEPWEIDITELLLLGKNELSCLVTNSLINFIQNERKPSGLTGSVSIRCFL